MPFSFTLSRLAATLGLISLALAVGGANVAAQAPAELPFAPGEVFEYKGRVRVGVAGRGSLRVEGPTELRGTSVWTLHSDMEGKLGFLRATDRSASWLDPMRMLTLRYSTRERHLLTRREDVVDVFPAERTWRGQDGAEGAIASEAPLDELSFLYYLRTLPLAADSTLRITRHYDPTRNPTLVTVIGREETTVGAGHFNAVVVEMRVRDARRYQGEGIIRVHLSDDRCRLILRLESEMPNAGKATLALASYRGTRSDCSARIP